MINEDGCIRYNHINKNLLGIVKIPQFKFKGQLQRAKLAATLKIDNINITDKLRKVISEDSFTVKFIKQLKTRLVEGFVVIKNLPTF